MKIIPGSEQDIEKLNELIIAFNLQQIPFPQNPPWKTLSFIYQNEEQFLGGVYGYLIMNNVLKIDVLYVLEQHRHCGYGTQLLQQLELEAKNQNAYLSILDTFDFQSLDFYQKNGYEIFATLENCPAPGHKCYSLKKELF